MDDATHPAGLPLLLNRYQVEETLGSGGFGTVVRARDVTLRRMVAIKTLKPALVARYPDAVDDLRARFQREAEAGSRMGVHPHIVTVHDLVTDTDSTLYLIQEFVPGGTLGQRLKAGALLAADALQFVTDAARGLQAAHEVGIVHRDVKPANLFLTRDGRLKVGDFGIAQIDDLSQRPASKGHPHTALYASPEQMQTTGYLTPQSDQYSLGLVLFEMLTGTAYRKLTITEAMARLAQFPEHLRVIVQRLLEAVPERRYPAMKDMIDACTEAQRAPNLGVPLLPAFVGHMADIYSVAFSPDGSLVASGSADQTVRVWRVADRSPLWAWNTQHAATAVAFASHGYVLASAADDARVRLWRVSDGTLLETFSGHESGVLAVAFAPDGYLLASGGSDCTVRLWRTIDRVALGALQGHTGPVRAVAFSPDGRTLVSGAEDGTIRLWDARDGRHIGTLTGHARTVFTVAFSPDGRLLASGSEDGTIRFWRAENGVMIRAIPIRSTVSGVAFSPDGSLLASGSADGVARLWRVDDGALHRECLGHFGWVNSVAFAPDGTMFAAADDRTILPWSTE